MLTISRKVNSYKILLVLFAVLGAFGAGATRAQAAAQTVWVATWGNDSNDTSGDYSHPFRTIQRAMKNITPGSTIWLRGGTYTMLNQEKIGAHSGTPNNLITIKSYTNENAVLDASQFNDYGAVYISASYIKLCNLEVRNSTSYGIYIDGDHDTVDNCSVSGSYESGIRFTGQYHTISNCKVWNNCKSNSARNTNGGWPSAIDGYQATQCSIHGCTVWENWGEGIGIQASDSCYIGYNDIRDSYSANVYVNSSTVTWVDTNICHSNWNSNFFRDGQPAIGIYLGNEYTDHLLNGIVIKGNTISECEYGLRFWSGGSGGGVMQNADIYSNNIQKATNALVLIEGGDHTGSKVHDNTYTRNWSWTVSIQGTGISVYGDTYN